MSKLWPLLAIIVGLVFIYIAYLYLTTPANLLPSFLPGYDPTLTKTHFKHAVGTLSIGIASFIFAWFASGKKSTQSKE